MKKILLTTAALSLISSLALADAKEFEITLKDHKFAPATVEVPAGEKVKLKVKNMDKTPEEFESHDLKREKVVKGESEITINVGPLKAGEYKFYGEYNEKTAQGKVVAK